MKCGLYEIKKNRANATHGPSLVQKNVPRPNRGDVGPERSRTRTGTCIDPRKLCGKSEKSRKIYGKIALKIDG